jgi:hypothetical protein
VPVAGGREYRVLPAEAVGAESPDSDLDLRPVLYGLVRERGWPLCELRREVRTLETVFAELTQSQLEVVQERGVEG